MIQRIQTIFLLIVGVAMLAFLFAPVWNKSDTSTGQSYTQTAFYLEQVPAENTSAQLEYMPYAIAGFLGIIATILAFVAIALYKKRMVQMMLCTVNSLVMGSAMGLSAYWATQADGNLLAGITGNYQYGLFLPAIALVFNSLATRFIRKDEKLVRSMDRLR